MSDWDTYVGGTMVALGALWSVRYLLAGWRWAGARIDALFAHERTTWDGGQR